MKRIIIITFIVGIGFGFEFNGSIIDVYYRFRRWSMPKSEVDIICEKYIVVVDNDNCYEVYGWD